jgi:hypothetical protein
MTSALVTLRISLDPDIRRFAKRVVEQDTGVGSGQASAKVMGMVHLQQMRFVMCHKYGSMKNSLDLYQMAGR